MELPTLQDDGAVAMLLVAFAAAVEDRVRELLDDADAARAVVAAAPKGVARAQLATGALSYVFSVRLPQSALGAAAGARRVQPAGVRDLQATAHLDFLSTLLTDGTLVARMKEMGVGNAQDLIDSGAMGVAVAAVAPSGTGTASGTPSSRAGAPSASPSGTGTASGTPSSRAGAPSASPSSAGAAAAGVFASLQLRGLPASAFDGSGRVTTAAVGIIAAALKRGVEGACAACSVTVTRVVDGAGAAVFTAGRRRMQFGLTTYTVFFQIGGPAAAAAAAAGINAGAVAAQLSAPNGFNTPITAAVPSDGGGSGGGGGGSSSSSSSSSSEGGLSSGTIAGIAGAAVLVVAALLCFYFASRVKAAISAFRGLPAPKAAPAFAPSASTAGLRLHFIS